ncbi:hypothetical protein L7F22_066356 [Adiantum nelumboides]|nr:hypothetical protein [Adiantum nelumboides]
MSVCAVLMTLGSTGTPLTHVWTKMGTMVAYTGEMKFKREGMMEHGFKHALKIAFTDEGATLVCASCTCPGMPTQLLLADEGKNVVFLRLTGDAVAVNGNNLLHLSPTLQSRRG